MKYFSTPEVGLALVLYALFGAVCGTLYPLRDRIPSVLAAVLRLPYAVYTTARRPSLPTASKNAQACIAVRIPLLRHLVDFLYVFAWGIGFLLLTYAVLDGVFRIWAVTVFLVCLFACRYTVGRWLLRVFDGFLHGVYTAVYLLVGTLAAPLVFCFHITYARLLRPPMYALVLRAMRDRSHRILTKKRGKAQKIFRCNKKSTKRKRESFDTLSFFMQSAKIPLNEPFFVDKNNKK